VVKFSGKRLAVIIALGKQYLNEVHIAEGAGSHVSVEERSKRR